jgi:hypothetical protein
MFLALEAPQPTVTEKSPIARLGEQCGFFPNKRSVAIAF